MAGVSGKSGRRKGAGDVYRFTFYYRFTPGQDPPELKDLLDSIAAAKGRKRRDILRAALLGGAEQAYDTAEKTEDSRDEALFDAMFDNF
jgi:hypothetical protein